MKRLGRGAVKLTKWLFGLAFLGLLGVYGYVRYDYASAADDLDYQMQRAKELGLPLDPAEMNPQPPVEAEENAAPLYREMSSQFEKLDDRLKGDRERIGLGAPYRPDSQDIEISKDILKELGPTLELAIAASKMPGVDFQRDWSEGPNLAFPELARQKEAAKWLTVRAVVSARSNSLDSALQDIEAVGRMAGHVGKEKTIIGGLVNVAIDAIAIRSVESIASFNSDRVKDLVRLKSLIRNLPPVPKFEECMRGEVFFGFYTSRNLSRYWSALSNDDANGDLTGLGVRSWQVFPPLIDSDLVERAYAARALSFWNEMFSIQEAAEWKPMLAGAELDRMAYRYEQSHRPSDVLGAILFPVFAQAGAAFEKMKGNRACARAMIDVLLFKNKSGRLPKTLAEAGVVEIDPFAGEPLKYRVTDFGFVIYGVGYDHKDNGGLLNWEKGYESSRRDEPMAVYPSWERSHQPYQRPRSADVALR